MGCHIALLLFAGSIAFATGGEERLVFLPEAAGQLSRVGLSPSLRSVDVELMVAQQEARRLNDEGVMMMSSLQYDRAEHLLRRAIDIHPSYPPALCNFGRLLARMGRDMQAASEMMRKAHLLLPSNAEISSAYARLLDEELSDFRAASKVYEEALSMQPSHHHLLHNFAEMLRGRQIDDSRAQELYKQVLKARPDFSASSIGLSLLLLRSGKLNEALQVLQEALVLDPKSVSLLNQQGLVLFEAHQMNEADRTFRSVLAVDPSNVIALCNLGTICSSDGERGSREGLSFLQRAASIAPHDGKVLNSCGNLMVQSGEIESGIPFLLRSYSLSPSSLEVSLDLCRALVAYTNLEETPRSKQLREAFDRFLDSSLSSKQEILEEVEEILLRMKGLYPSSSTLLRELSDFYRQCKYDLPRSIELMSTALAQQPKDPDCSLRLSLLLEQVGNHSEALLHLRRSKEVNPSRSDLQQRYANLLLKSDKAEAVEAHKKALAMAPNHVPTIVGYALLLKEEEKYEEAEKLYRQALELNPNSSVLACNYGSLLWDWQEDEDEAVRWFRNAQALDPSNAEVYLRRGEIEEDHHIDLEAAIDFYCEASQRSTSAEGYTRAAYIHLMAYNNTAQAYALYEKAWKLDPLHSPAVRGYAAMVATLEGPLKSIPLYRQAFRLQPSDPHCRGELADICQLCGNYDEAEELYLTALSARPSDSQILRGYANLLRAHRHQEAFAQQLVDLAKVEEVKTVQKMKQQEEEWNQFLSQNKTVKLVQYEDGKAVHQDEILITSGGEREE